MQRALVCMAALSVVGLLAGCGEDGSPQGHLRGACAPCALPDTPLLPDRWIALRRVASGDDCCVASRRAAVRAMAEAGPDANLVLPTLEALGREGPPVLRAEARAVRRALVLSLTQKRRRRSIE